MDMTFTSRSVVILATVLLVFFISCKNKEKADKPVQTPQSAVKTESDNTGFLFPFIDDSRKWGYLDKLGNVIIEPQFEMAMGFSDGYARVRVENKWGYVNAHGKTAITPQFERARDFNSGIAATRVNRKWGYIDKTGRFLIEPQFSKLAQSIAEGYAAVPDSNKKFGYIDATGKLVVQHKFDNAHEFSEGLAAVEEGGKWGFIDATGNWVIGPQYVWADKFVDGHSLVRIGLHPNVDYALIDRKSDVKFRLQTLHCKTARDGLMRFEMNGKWGFVDKTGKTAIPPTYDAAMDFSEGLAAVRVGNGWGYIDTQNKMVVNIEYNVAEEFHGGLARVTWPGGKWGYVDRTGRKIWDSAIPGTLTFGSGDSETED